MRNYWSGSDVSPDTDGRRRLDELDALAARRGDNWRVPSVAWVRRLLAATIPLATADIYRRLMAVEQKQRRQGVMIVNLQEYAAAVDAETDRIADLLEQVIEDQKNDDANDQAALDAAFAPVLERLRGVGKDAPADSGSGEQPVEEPPAGNGGDNTPAPGEGDATELPPADDGGDDQASAEG